MQTKRENRGGKRAGSGRKAGGTNSALSQNQLDTLMRTAKKYARKHKKTVEELLLDLVYGFSEDPKFGDKERLQAMKLFLDRTNIPVSEGSDADKELGKKYEPQVYLPERRPDPANEPVASDDKKVG